MPTAPPNARDLTRVLVSYRAPSLARSIIELAITGGPLVLLWFLMWATLDLGYWLSLLLAVPAAGFLVRLFMIQHDCGHGAFFHRRGTNDWVGRVIGVLTLTPYDFWRRTHAAHHSTSGNLDRRGIGDIDTLTVDEYLARSRWGRLRYRVYRHPIIMFGVGPAYLFIIQHRLPVGLMRGGWRPWLSAMATNVAIAAVVATMIWLVGRRSVPARASADHIAGGLGRCLAVLCPAPIREYQHGPATEPGICKTWRFTAARTTPCQACCAGSRPILGFITFIICAAESPVTDCRSCCATTRNFTALAGLRCFRVSGVCDSCCGTKVNNGSSLSVRCVSIVLRFEGRPEHPTYCPAMKCSELNGRREQRPAFLVRREALC